MGEFLMSEKSKRNFQDILFDHLNRILEMTKNEFTGGYYNTIVSGNLTKNEYIGDKKEEYCQLVEALADVLYPHFNEEMKTFYIEYEKKLEEATNKYHDENGEPLSNENYKIFSRIRLKLTRRLFRELNILLKDKQYLKAQTFGQTDNTETFEEEEE